MVNFQFFGRVTEYTFVAVSLSDVISPLDILLTSSDTGIKSSEFSFVEGAFYV